MRIGIDASRAFVDRPTGTERYAFEVITRMLQLPEARKHTWILYTKSCSTQYSGLSTQIIPLKYLWTQVGLAYRTWVDKLDVLWIPAHTLPLLRKPGLRTVVTIHGIEYEWLPAYENRLQRWYLPLSTQYAVHNAHKIIAVSEFTKKQLIERLGAQANKIEVIHEGFDVQPQNNKNNVFIDYNLRSREYLITVGTIQPRKNLERLIQAFARLRGSKRRRLKLVIVGKWGWNYDGVKAAPKKFGVGERVLFLDYVDDAARQRLLEKALIYVQASITEGFGLPVLEAMNAGVPVVSSNGGALPEVVGQAGLLFDPMSIDDISHKLSLAIDDHKLRKELVERGRMRVRAFGWEETAKKTLNLIVTLNKLIV